MNQTEISVLISTVGIVLSAFFAYQAKKAGANVQLQKLRAEEKEHNHDVILDDHNRSRKVLSEALDRVQVELDRALARLDANEKKIKELELREEDCEKVRRSQDMKIAAQDAKIAELERTNENQESEIKHLNNVLRTIDQRDKNRS